MRALCLIAEDDPRAIPGLETVLREAEHVPLRVHCAELPSALARELPALCLLGPSYPRGRETLPPAPSHPAFLALGTPLHHSVDVPTLPWPARPGALEAVVRELLGRRSAELELADRRSREVAAAERCLSPEHPAARRLRPLLKRLAEAEAPLLLLGPATEARRVAEWLHQRSPRRPLGFAASNCAAPDVDLEGKLFGARSPAFLDRLAGGTLFLSEIGDLSPRIQRRLLEVLETGSWAPPGGTPRPLDVRLISSTARDLDLEVARGRFSAELRYRLGVLMAELPAPNEADPGADLFQGMRSLRDVEEALIRRVLSETAGNRSEAARILGIHRATLYNKLRLYGIPVPDPSA